MFFSRHRIISHDRIYVERMFWGPPDRFSSPTEKIIAKTIIRICPFRQILSCSNLPTSSVELIWPITELYFRQILSTDLMNRFCQDVKTGPYCFVFVLIILSFKPRPFVQLSFDICRRPDNHTFLVYLEMVALSKYFWYHCRFLFVLWCFSIL